MASTKTVTRFRQPKDSWVGDDVIVRTFPRVSNGEPEGFDRMEIRAFTNDNRVIVAAKGQSWGNKTWYYVAVRTNDKATAEQKKIGYDADSYWGGAEGYSYKRYYHGDWSFAEAVKVAEKVHAELLANPERDPWTLYFDADVQPFVEKACEALAVHESRKDYTDPWTYEQRTQAHKWLSKAGISAGHHGHDSDRLIRLLFLGQVEYVGSASAPSLVRVVVEDRDGYQTERDVLPVETMGGTILSDGAKVIAEGTLLAMLQRQREFERERWLDRAVECRHKYIKAVESVAERAQRHLDDAAKGRMPDVHSSGLHLASQYLEEANVAAAHYHEVMSDAYRLGIPQRVQVIVRNGEAGRGYSSRFTLAELLARPEDEEA